MCSICEAKKNGWAALTFEIEDGSIWALGASSTVVDRQFLASSNQSSNNLNGKPSFTTDEAADQLIRQLIKWDDGDVMTGRVVDGFYDATALGTPGTVTYGFLSSAGIAALDDEEPENVPLSAAEQAIVTGAIQSWAAVANIVFEFVGADLASRDDAEIAIMGESGTNGGSAGYRFFDPVGNSLTGRLDSALVDTGTQGLANYGAYAHLTAVHEIGHAIGISHPGAYDSTGFNYSSDAEYYQDTFQYTVMSYWNESFTGGNFGFNRNPTVPMLHDIAAIQKLYGANVTTYAGETVYGFGSNTGHETWDLDQGIGYIIGAIWDVGGIDTLDFSGHTADQEIYLEQETFSSTGGLTNNLSIAPGVKIENATGGSGNDLIVGNDVDASHVDAMFWSDDGTPLGGSPTGFDGANILVGNDGDDTLMGGSGNDLLIGDGVPVDLEALLGSL